MKKVIYIAILLLFVVNTANSQSKITVVSGKYSSKKGPTLLKTFTASQSDIIEIKLNVDHKRKGLHLWIKQHPGNVIVFDYEDEQNYSKTLVAPADAIYQVYVGGSKVDFNIDIINHTNKPNGNGRGKPVYVRMPDTLHVSGYVNRPIGEKYSIVPYKEKIQFKKSIISEPICNRDFFTGVDLINLSIPGNVKDEYREQKLLSYTVTLTCGELSMHKAMMGVVDAGIDAFVKIPGPKSANKDKLSTGKANSNYTFTNKLDAASEKLETATDLVEIGTEATDTLAPGSKGDDALATTAFILNGGVQEIVLEKALDAAGVPSNIQSVIGAVQSFPSVSDLAKKGVRAIIPKIKGSAHIVVEGEMMAKETVSVLPAKGFWIQSAMNYGVSGGGCWDIGGEPTSTKNGMSIKVWDINNGKDRLYKLVPSKKIPGFYEIHSAMAGNGVVDISGGKQEKGTNIQLWEDNNSSAQAFKFQHLGAGKFKILSTKNKVVCLAGGKNANGTNVHLWDDHNAPQAYWYLVDPVTKKGILPTTKTVDVMKKYAILNKKGGYINEEIKVNSANAEKNVFIKIYKQNVEAMAKLIVEAKYEITDYTDVIKYKRVTTPVNTKDFWTAYKINYNYAIMFEDQTKPYYEKISASQYKSKLKSEIKDETNTNRLMQYDVLTKPAAK